MRLLLDIPCSCLTSAPGIRHLSGADTKERTGVLDPALPGIHCGASGKLLSLCGHLFLHLYKKGFGLDV